jgi:hypothetical protein
MGMNPLFPGNRTVANGTTATKAANIIAIRVRERRRCRSVAGISDNQIVGSFAVSGMATLATAVANSLRPNPSGVQWIEVPRCRLAAPRIARQLGSTDVRFGS